MFPEFLYRLTPRDEQVTPLENIAVRLNGTSAAATTVNSATYTVPLGKILLLNTAVVRAKTTVVGLTQPIYTQVFADPVSSAAGVSILYNVYSGAFAADATTNFWANNETLAVPVIVPEGYAVYAQGVFADAVAGNTLDLHITGVLIPRGNFAI